MNKWTEPKTRTSLTYQQARRHHQNGEIGKAVTLYGQALAAQPRHTSALLHLGEIAYQTRNLDQAAVLLKRAVLIDSRFVEAYNILWQVCHAQGDLDGAIRILQRQTELRPYEGNNYFNLGRMYQERGQSTEARQMFETALRWNPNDAQMQATLGDLLQEQGNLHIATTHYYNAVHLESRNSQYLSKLGYLLARQGHLTEAIAQIDKASLLDPTNDSIRRNRWQTLLRLGSLREGFAEAEARFQMKDCRPIYGMYAEIPRWHGENFSGRLLIHPDTLIEDIFQFARYLPLVKAQGGTLIVALPRLMMKLFSYLQCIDEIIEATPANIAAARPDLTASILSLPALFDTSLDTVPSRTPYLFADPFLTHSWVRRLNWKTYKVGLAWSVKDIGNGNVSSDRSAGLAALETLLSIPGISWYSLQNETGISADLAQRRLPISDNAGGLRDSADVAALAANMDLIIAIDSPQAHLAAAIGRPVWTLLPFDAGWRWLHQREDTPWYPTMRLFRQTQPGDWNGVIRRVAAELSPTVRPLRKIQQLQGAPPALFAETAVQY